MSLQAPLSYDRWATAPAVSGGADATTVIAEAPFDGTVSAVTYAPVSAITGANTNTRLVQLVNKGQSGSGTTVVASLQFDSGVNAAASDEKAITLSAVAGATTVVAGDVLAWVSTHVGTGIADPGGMVDVTFTRS